ncbi:MAG: hypothetical protein H0V44_00125 [Planctomycetes bacterium]|nr:hypothetical protein [Planctomycetota bacterium]
MSIVLECLSGAHKGRRIPTGGGKPLVFKLKKHDRPAGQVVVEMSDQTCIITNRSEIPCLVNGVERPRCAVRHGDEVVIGKDTFKVVDEADTMATQAITPLIIDDEPKLLRCSACRVIFNPQQGWSEGGKRLCRACLAKGVKPESLNGGGPAPAVSPAAAPGVATEDLGTVPPVVPKPAPGPKSSARERTPLPVADGERHSKRISASRLALVEPAPTERNGLFRKVTAMLGGGRAERQRLDQLEGERNSLLVEAGRLSLGGGGGMGINDKSVMALSAGKDVLIRQQELDGAVFDQWKTLRERAQILDTEISALRRVLDLGPDTDALLKPAPALRPAKKAQQDQAFANLDGYGTENLDSDEPLELKRTPTPAPVTVPARSLSSGRNRATRRKR